VQAPLCFMPQTVLGGFFNGLDVDDVIGHVDGPSHFDFLPFELAGLADVVQHVRSLASRIAQNEVVTVFRHRSGECFRLSLGLLLHCRTGRGGKIEMWNYGEDED
jgi:hypothetical protein